MKLTLRRTLCIAGGLSLIACIGLAQPPAPAEPPDPEGAPPLFDRPGPPAGPDSQVMRQHLRHRMQEDAPLPFINRMEEREKARGGDREAGGMELSPFWRRDGVREKLHLTDEQVEKLDAGYVATRQKLIDFEAASEHASLELEEAMNAEKPDVEKVNSAIDKLGKARTEIQKATTGQKILVKITLTPEQQKQIQQFMRQQAEKRVRLFDEFRGQREGGPSGPPNAAPGNRGPAAGPEASFDAERPGKANRQNNPEERGKERRKGPRAQAPQDSPESK